MQISFRGYVILKIAIFGNYPYNTIIFNKLSIKKESILLKIVKKYPEMRTGSSPEYDRSLSRFKRKMVKVMQNIF